MSVGMDIGTAFLVSARQDANNQVQIRSIRDAFLDLDNQPQVKQMLKISNTDFIEAGEKIYLVGEPALVLANIFNKEARRPLSQGVISPGELQAERVLAVLLDNVLGKAVNQGETCFFSVPAVAVDKPMDVIYHEAMFSKLISNMGYSAHPLNEAAAIVYSNAAKENFSALSISCLTPGQKVITERGFVNIEEIKDGDKVLNKNGDWNFCRPTKREYDGTVYLIEAYGNGKVEVTGDHQIWIGRNGHWDWIPASQVEKGDLIMQPWPNYNFNKSRFICIEERVTCSKLQNVTLNLTTEMAELLGYFLGDGCIEYGNSDTTEGCGIGFTFSVDEKDNIERVKSLISDLFQKDTAEYPHGENAIRIKMYSKGFSKWIKNNCFDSNKEKILPWNVSDLCDNHVRFILRGLIASDGSMKDNYVGFSNTNPFLAQFVYLAMLRLGMNPSFCVKPPRNGGLVDGGTRMIVGKKESYEIQSTGVEAWSFVQWSRNPMRSSKKSYNHGYSVARINKIESKHYKGIVYDASVVEGDPSFCVPGIAIHNCGAGMVNVCLMYKTMIGMAFSIAKSGDWIDQNAARSTGTTASRIVAIKERGTNLMDMSDGDPKTQREREAIIVYYKSLIISTLDTISAEFMKRQGTIDLPNAVPIIVSGGTSKAKGFVDFFKQIYETKKSMFAIPISEIRAASDPLNAVSQGLLVAAMNHDEGSAS